MRYGDASHLETWRARGAFPAIHDDLFALIAEESEGRRFLDLACCYGLLAERLRARLRVAYALGVDARAEFVDAARVAGIAAVELLDVKPESVKHLGALVALHKLNVLVARRALPEVLATPRLDEAFAHDLLSELRRAGVCEVFLQGRVPQPGARCALASVDDEVALLERVSSFRLAVKRGQCAYLKSP